MAAPAVGVRRRWTPDPSTSVDWSHPLATGLMTAQVCVGSDVVDLTDLAAMTRSGAPTRGVTRFGAGQVNDAANEGAILTVGTAHPLCLQPPLTFMWVGARVGVPSSDCWLWGVIYSNNDSSPYLSYGFQFGGSAELWVAANDGGSFIHDSLGTLAVGPHVLVGVLNAGGGSVGYIDGVPTNNTGTGGIAYSATSSLSLCAYPTTSRPTNCTTNFATIWNRALNANEVAVLTDDPFCFVRR